MIRALQPLCFSTDLLLEQVPLLTESIRRILSQHSQFSRNIRKAMAEAGTDAVEGGAEQRFR